MPTQSVYSNPQMWSLVVGILTAPQRLVLKAWSSAAVVRGGIFGRYLTDEGWSKSLLGLEEGVCCDTEPFILIPDLHDAHWLESNHGTTSKPSGLSQSFCHSSEN